MTSPTDEDGEQYQTYFLNMVDEADLLAAMQAAAVSCRSVRAWINAPLVLSTRIVPSAP